MLEETPPPALRKRCTVYIDAFNYDRVKAATEHRAKAEASRKPKI